MFVSSQAFASTSARASGTSYHRLSNQWIWLWYGCGHLWYGYGMVRLWYVWLWDCYETVMVWVCHGCGIVMVWLNIME